MKTFVYYVGEHRWEDTEAWGEAWKMAKTCATELHTMIYREVIKDGKIRHEVFYKGGLFNSVEYMREDNVKIW